jgi:hypothetical protein
VAVWEISEEVAARAAASARTAKTPVRYVLAVERVERPGDAPEPLLSVDLPDALGGESWYVDLPRAGGFARARIGLDLGGRMETLLESRWAPVPPDGPCAEDGPWEIPPEHRAWLAGQSALAKARGSDVSSPTGRFPLPVDPARRDA